MAAGDVKARRSSIQAFKAEFVRNGFPVPEGLISLLLSGLVKLRTNTVQDYIRYLWTLLRFSGLPSQQKGPGSGEVACCQAESWNSTRIN